MLRKPPPDYTWFRCVTPSWDNSARRQKGANIFINSTPDKYRDWLDSVLKYTNMNLTGDESIVFVNAWNEWAEGNHLEPCSKWGRAYLVATRDAAIENSYEKRVTAVKLFNQIRNSGVTDRIRINLDQIQVINGKLHLNGWAFIDDDNRSGRFSDLYSCQGAQGHFLIETLEKQETGRYRLLQERKRL